jgi:hypothetical protein
LILVPLALAGGLLAVAMATAGLAQPVRTARVDTAAANDEGVS